MAVQTIGFTCLGCGFYSVYEVMRTGERRGL